MFYAWLKSQEHSIQSLWYERTHQQPGIKPIKPLGQLCVPPIVLTFTISRSY